MVVSEVSTMLHQSGVVGSNERPQRDYHGMNPSDQMEVMLVRPLSIVGFFSPVFVISSSRIVPPFTITGEMPENPSFVETQRACRVVAREYLTSTSNTMQDAVWVYGYVERLVYFDIIT